MSGIYIHIPFCRQACSYCNFHFSTSLKLKDKLIDAILKELEIKKNFFRYKVETIYFGGGTPSLLSISDINKIMDKIYRNYKIKGPAEVTLEANPDDLKKNYVKELKAAGIDRLSIGVQTFQDRSLKFLNRTHTATEAINAVINAKNSDISKITIDLIYGISGNSLTDWKNDLKQINELEINHFSAYALTIEPKTLLAYKIKTKPEILSTDENYLKQFEILLNFAEKSNFEHYEISNFARNKEYAIHNTNYWKNKAYIGVGPSAHSFNKKIRKWNIANNAIYIENINNMEPFDESEILSMSDRYNEYILTGLRTKWGCSTFYIEMEFGKKFKIYFEKNIKKYIDNALVFNTKKHYYLSDKGKFIADRICSDMFYI